MQRRLSESPWNPRRLAAATSNDKWKSAWWGWQREHEFGFGQNQQSRLQLRFSPRTYWLSQVDHIAPSFSSISQVLSHLRLVVLWSWIELHVVHLVFLIPYSSLESPKLNFRMMMVQLVKIWPQFSPSPSSMKVCCSRTSIFCVTHPRESALWSWILHLAWASSSLAWIHHFGLALQLVLQNQRINQDSVLQLVEILYINQLVQNPSHPWNLYSIPRHSSKTQMTES